MTNSEEPKTLGEALPEEQARVRELIRIYRDPVLRGAGEFTARLMEVDLQAADKAVMSGDVAAMINAYNTLKEWKE